MESWEVRNGHEVPGSGVRSWESKGLRAKSKDFEAGWRNHAFASFDECRQTGRHEA